MNVRGRLGHLLAMVAGGVVVWGVAVHGFSPAESPAVTPVQVVAASPHSPTADVCAVRCPGYVEPDTSYHAAPSFTAPVIPTSGVVTVYVAAPAQATQPTSSKASKSSAQPKQAKASSSKASGGSSKASSKALAAPKAPKQTVPSTTTTTDRTTTTSKGTTTTTHTTTTTQKG